MIEASGREGDGWWRNRDFLLFLAARILSTAAFQIQVIAVGWKVYERTSSFFLLGMVGLSQFLPFAFVALWSGQVADRHDRRSILLAGTLVNLLGAIVLGLAFGRLHGTWPILLVLAFLGAARSLMMPANQAYLRNLVTGEGFERAVAVNSSGFHAAVVAGPLLGGWLLGWGTGAVFGTVAALLSLSLGLLALIRTRKEPATGQAPYSLRLALEGLAFIRSRPVILGAISLDLFAVLLGGATALLPAVARDFLHADAFALGILRAAPAVGAGLATLWLAAFPVRRQVGRWMLGGVAVYGLATVLFGLSRELWISVGALALLGSGDMVSVYVRSVLVQSQTPDALRGRVSAVNGLFIGASNELGEFESGLLAACIGAGPALVAGGLASVAIAVSWAYVFPALGRMDTFPDGEPEGEACAASEPDSGQAEEVGQLVEAA